MSERLLNLVVYIISELIHVTNILVQHVARVQVIGLHDPQPLQDLHHNLCLQDAGRVLLSDLAAHQEPVIMQLS